MATKMQQILETALRDSVLFGSWLSSQGLDARGQYSYIKVVGWIVYRKEFIRYMVQLPHLMAMISSYNTQFGKRCIVGAYTALENRGYFHYLPMGIPMVYLFTDKTNKLPSWLLKEEWEMTINI